jgi:hypothetical protein
MSPPLIVRVARSWKLSWTEGRFRSCGGEHTHSPQIRLPPDNSQAVPVPELQEQAKHPQPKLPRPEYVPVEA